jgi:LacI family transcriptional regulator
MSYNFPRRHLQMDCVPGDIGQGVRQSGSAGAPAWRSWSNCKKPSAVARAMVSQRTNNIGVIVFRENQPIVSHPLYGKLIDSILLAAEARGYSVFLKTDQEISLRSTDYMLEQRIDGLILVSRLRKNVIDYVKKFNIPYLMVNSSTDDPDVIHLVWSCRRCD